jgi:hypothetical protein
LELATETLSFGPKLVFNALGEIIYELLMLLLSPDPPLENEFLGA